MHEVGFGGNGRSAGEVSPYRLAAMALCLQPPPGDARRWWLRYQHDLPRCRVRRKTLECEQHHRPADALIEVSAADTDRLGYSFTTGIDQAGHLLQAGTGGADPSNASRAHGVSKPERQPTDYGGAAIRAHQQSTFAPRKLLQLHLVLDRDVVAEQEHVETCF